MISVFGKKFYLSSAPEINDVTIEEDDKFVYVKFLPKPYFIKKAKSIFPYKFSKILKAWVYPKLIREEVYKTFGLECPPDFNKANFTINEPLPPYLFNYQKQCIELARKYSKFGFFLDMGLGKTVIVCNILNYKKCKTLIVAPLSILETVWEKHLRTFSPSLEVINLYNFKKDKRKHFIKHHNGVHIINYEGFRISFEDFLNADYKCLIIDESSKLRGRTTQIAKRLIKMAHHTPSVYLLSGNPCPNSKLEFFVQAHAIAPGLLGWNYYQFRNRYFRKASKWEWTENKETFEEFENRLKKIAIFISKEDVLNELPEKNEIIKKVYMTEEQKRYYQELVKFYSTVIKGKQIETPTVLTQISKLRQITSGFVYFKDEKNERDKKSIRFYDPKLKVLKETIEEIPKEKQIIVWCTFEDEIKKLKEEIKDSEKIYGKTKSDERERIINDFKNKKFRILIAHPQTLGHGQNLQNASYAIYYSLDWSAEFFTQSKERIHRPGQKDVCTYIYLLCENSIDEVMYEKLLGKIKSTKEILEKLKIIKKEETNQKTNLKTKK